MGQVLSEFRLIVVAAGKGSRMLSDVPKQYMNVGSKTVLRHTLDAFCTIPGLKEICVVINPDHKYLYDKSVQDAEYKDKLSTCFGGSTRKESVHSGIKSFSHIGADDIVLIHDAARPFVRALDVKNLLRVMGDYKAASLASQVTDTIRVFNDNNEARSAVPRNNLCALQTPQAFHYGVLKQAHETSDPKKDYTDDTAIVSDLGIYVKIVKTGKHNFKITTQEDMHMAKLILSTNLSTSTRVGIGYDVHAFDERASNIKTIRLCGVDMPFDRKLKGHSDADVGLHAVCDAVLGAIGEGDIGTHFPPSNNDYKNMDSALFLEHAMRLLHNKNGSLVNVDITLICEQPKIGAYRMKIIDRLANIMGISTSCVNIKATTTERMGFTGRKEGIAAQAVVNVIMPNSELV